VQRVDFSMEICDHAFGNLDDVLTLFVFHKLVREKLVFLLFTCKFVADNLGALGLIFLFNELKGRFHFIFSFGYC
jgi:hypothetical protein